MVIVRVGAKEVKARSLLSGHESALERAVLATEVCPGSDGFTRNHGTLCGIAGSRNCCLPLSWGNICERQFSILEFLCPASWGEG